MSAMLAEIAHRGMRDFTEAQHARSSRQAKALLEERACQEIGSELIVLCDGLLAHSSGVPAVMKVQILGQVGAQVHKVQWRRRLGGGVAWHTKLGLGRPQGPPLPDLAQYQIDALGRFCELGHGCATHGLPSSGGLIVGKHIDPLKVYKALISDLCG
ncbi:hypothetical protein RQP54_14960 [Curvibacter sp. APW13]|uniref:hypothetical protein n=1 Tax=Curvibacter sp. APW13 TaxID=3077236 RepID=UPI0028DD7515|nr:hypothetical protein [Curvibacter sp. APW13]MDT8992170.1 hypothetical protein [Curvibacter sp. APW13]